jgi:hypothetical protein
MTPLPYELKETLVSLKDISLKFGDKVILKPFSAEVRDIARPGFARGRSSASWAPPVSAKPNAAESSLGFKNPPQGPF